MRVTIFSIVSILFLFPFISLADFEPKCGSSKGECLVGNMNGLGETGCVNSAWSSPTREYGWTWDCVGPDYYRGKTVSCFFPGTTDKKCPADSGGGGSQYPTLSLTLKKAGDGRGSLSLYGGSGGAFATCSPDCSSATKNELIADAEYAVYATPETGSSFGGFTEGCSRVDDTYVATQNTYICYTGRHSSSFAVTAKFCKGTSCSSSGGSGGGSGGGGGGSGGGSGGGGGGGGTGMCTPEGYVTTGPESQVKSGALGIMGAFKAYLGIDVNGKSVTHVGTPTDSSDAATKDYVDQAIARASGGGVGESSCFGPTGGFTKSPTNLGGGGGSCSNVWGVGGDGCQAQPGYSCGIFAISGSNYSSYLCVKNSCGKGVTGGYVYKVGSSGGGFSDCVSTWGVGAQGVPASENPNYESCRSLPGYACGVWSFSGGGQNNPLVYYGVCLKN